MATAILLPGKEKRVFSGHPWIFRSDIEKVKGDFVPGDVVTVQAKNGRFLAKAIYNPKSQIALRILSHKDEVVTCCRLSNFKVSFVLIDCFNF